jgi:phenylacetate-coenzyme A ligase PaaK-like adenylate-forming protein
VPPDVPRGAELDQGANLLQGEDDGSQEGGFAMFDPWIDAWTMADAWAVAQADARAWQQRQVLRLAALLRAAAECPLHRERLEAADRRCEASSDPFTRLRALAPIGKHEFVARYDDGLVDRAVSLADLRAFCADPAAIATPYRNRYFVWQSTGTSGQPTPFVQDAAALAVYDALEALRGGVATTAPARSATGLDGLRIAFVGAIDEPFASVVSLQRLRRLHPWLERATRLFSFLEPAERLAPQLEAFAPHVLASYPSTAWVLACQQAEGRLKLDLQAVWTGGETLTPAVRAAIGRHFGCTVRDSYGASECFTMASECRHGRLHLNADWVILEPVDEHGRAVPPGEWGRTTWLTSLANRVQPILRLDLGDQVRFVGTACECGSALPAIEVRGRRDEVLALVDAQGTTRHLTGLAVASVLEDVAGVFDFEVHQTGPRALALELTGSAASPGLRERAGDALRELLVRNGLPAVRLRITTRRGPRGPGRGGKVRKVFAG